MRHDTAGSDQGAFADGDTAHNRDTGSEPGSPLNNGFSH